MISYGTRFSRLHIRDTTHEWGNKYIIFTSVVVIIILFFGLCNASEPSSFRLLFMERFDDANFSQRGWYDIYAYPALVWDTDRGSNVMEIMYANTGNITPTPNPGRRIHFEATDTIYVAYYIKYSSNWTWTGLDYGPHEFYILTDLDPDYIGPARTHMTGYIEGQNGKGVLSIQDGININASMGPVPNNLVGVTEQRSIAGCNGSSDAYGSNATCYLSNSLWWNGKIWKTDNVVLTSGVWHRIEVKFKMNRIVNDRAVADGHLKYWIDGINVMNKEDIVFRTGQYPNMKWNKFMIGPYFHNGVRNTQSFRIDDLGVWVPVEGTFSNTPNSPTGLKVSL